MAYTFNSMHIGILITKAIGSIRKGSHFLLSGIYACLACLFPLRLCTWTEDEGFTFLPWLAEGQYYRKRRQSCPILKLWGLIFLKSLAIVFDKSIWEAFRERIRDAPWPTFLPPPLSPTPPPQVLDQSFNHACLKDGHSNLQLHPSSAPPPEPSLSPSSPPVLSFLLSLVVFLSICPFYFPIYPSSPFSFSHYPRLSVSAYQTEPMLNDSVWARGHSSSASWCLDLAKGAAWNVRWQKTGNALDISHSQFSRSCCVLFHYPTDHSCEECGNSLCGSDCIEVDKIKIK